MEPKNCMKKSDVPVPKVEEPDDLEFPDWSGMDTTSARISVDAAFRFCEQYAAWFPEAARVWQSRRVEKCPVEFVL
jgi:hypothetical protein